MILDASFLISVDRGDEPARVFLETARAAGEPLHTTHPVVAQVWRDGATQARLATFVRSVEVHPLDDGAVVGRLLAQARATDVVDAHLVVVAVRLGQGLVTGDVHDLTRLAEVFGSLAPVVHAWP